MAITGINLGVDYRLPATQGIPAFTAVGQLLLDRALPDLIKNYELIRWGVDAVQPAGTGLKIYAPTFDNIAKIHTAKIAAGNEAVVSTADALTFGHFSGDLEYYQQPIDISKVFGATATLKEYAQRAANYLMLGCAMTQEDLAEKVCAFSTGVTYHDGTDPTKVGWVAPDGATAHGAVDVTKIPSIKGMSKARKLLKKASNPGFSEASGKYVAMVGPEWVDQMITNVTSIPTFEESSMGMHSAFIDNKIGTLSGFMIVETNNIHDIIPNANNALAAGLAATKNGELNLLFAPGAFYVSSHASLKPMINVVPFNTPSKSDPSGQKMVIAVDYMAGAFAGRIPESMVHMPVGTD